MTVNFVHCRYQRDIFHTHQFA